MFVKGTISSVPARANGSPWPTADAGARAGGAAGGAGTAAGAGTPAGAGAGAWISGAAGATASTGAAGGDTGDGAGAPPDRCSSIRPRTSDRVILPPSPVPLISDGSRPFSSRRRRTTGERIRLSPPDPFAPPAAGVVATGTRGGADGAVGVGAGGVRGAWGAAAATGAGATGAGATGAGAAGAGATGAGAGACGTSGGVGATGAGAASGAGAAAGAWAVSGPGAVAPSATTARTVPTSTVSPSGTRISVSTPPAGEGTSESTLSVDTSKRGSSRSMVSPTAFNHFVTVPSVTVSPSCGITTSAKM
jgi:hypothetical protein